jgi:hypothetical protein
MSGHFGLLLKHMMPSFAVELDRPTFWILG